MTSDISGPTVSRAEMRAGSALVASAQTFYQHMLAQLGKIPNNKWGLVFHSYRQDCTTGHKKLCAMELESAWVISEADGLLSSWERFETIKRLADLVQVGDESGAGCVDTTLKAMTSLGCPSWRDVYLGSFGLRLYMTFACVINHVCLKLVTTNNALCSVFFGSSAVL